MCLSETNRHGIVPTVASGCFTRIEVLHLDELAEQQSRRSCPSRCVHAHSREVLHPHLPQGPFAGLVMTPIWRCKAHRGCHLLPGVKSDEAIIAATLDE
jgi:hypothetical protein